MLIARSIDVPSVIIYVPLEDESRRCSSFSETINGKQIPFFKDIYLGSVIIAKPRTDSGDNYMLSSPMRGKDPRKPLICLRNLKTSNLTL